MIPLLPCRARGRGALLSTARLALDQRPTRLRRALAVVGGATLLVAVASTGLTAQSEDTTTSGPSLPGGYEAVHSALTEASVGGELLLVGALGLRLEAARLVFLKGALHPLRAPTGTVVGAVFVGSGRFELRPPSRVERGQLGRFFETDSLSVALRSAVVYFTGDTWTTLESRAPRVTGAVPGEARDAVEEALDFLHEDDEEGLDPDLVQPFLNGDVDFLHLHLIPENGDRLYYRFEPDAVEEVSFGREEGDGYELVSRFHRVREYGAGEVVGAPTAAEDAGRDSMAVTHYEIDATFEDELDFSASAVLTLEGTRRPGQWIRLALDREIRVDSLRWASDAPVEYARREDAWSLWVRLPAAEREAYRLRVWYRGDDVVEYRRGWYVPSTAAYWYPRLGRSMSTFDLTFRHPDDRTLVTIGRKVSSRREEDTVVSRWTTDFPAMHASFNFGDYREYRLTDPRVPPVTLQVNAEFHRELMARDLEPGLRILSLDRDAIEQQVGGDLMNAIAFYTSWFGPPPMDELYAAEIAGTHGQAFPGMIHLSWLSFQIIRRSDVPQMLRSHEVAHQWWGLGVEPETYHDSWLSEGLATFASLWYRQLVRGERKAYVDRFDEFREDILDRSGKAGPVWLGPRLYTSDTEEDYSLIVYGKGAWVFHMLRNLFLDLGTMDESRFRRMLANLYERYRGDRLSTEEFEAHVERHAGIEMDWFFDQWVYGTAVPKYRVSYAKEPIDGGEFRLRLRVAQEGVPEDFQMSVPASVRLANDDRVRFRMMVRGPVSTMELPPLPAEPEEVTFNILDSVLAEVDDDGWVE